MPLELKGQIERITYTNEENGFTIAKVKVAGRHDLITVVGNLMAPTPGETLKMRGEWGHHKKYGMQFKVEHHATEVPSTSYGIEKYLGSGLVKGIGPVMAGRIVKKFGLKTLHIIENEITRLSQVAGIGRKRIEMIKTAWDDQKEIRDVMLFLQSHGISPGFATKIFRRYKNRSIAVVKENPYRLATDIFGVGFLTADRIAEKLAFPRDAKVRVSAGILYVLHQISEEGHVYYPCELLVKKCEEILSVDREKIIGVLPHLSAEKKIVIEELNRKIHDTAGVDRAVYPAMFYVCETGIAARLKMLIHTPRAIRRIDPEKAIKWLHQKTAFSFAEKQIEAITCALKNKVMIITGGPGTGKTTIINAILKIFSMLKVRVMLAAPTGRAAKRMSETAGYGAKTIHRLLEFSMKKGGFQRNEEKPLNCALIIIDEASMIDTRLMHALLKAIPATATLILVGDVNQLPSVGAGNVLKDIIDSKTVPVVELNKIFRQAERSLIIVNAHKINSGKLPSFSDSMASGSVTDFYFIEQENPEKVLEIILTLTKLRIPRRFGFDPVNDIQVLSPMHKGVVGTANLNKVLQNVHNPGNAGVTRGGVDYRVNDKVMQIKNNYEKEVFNGDIGSIKRIHLDLQEVIISFDDREVTYDFADLDEIVLAYAVSVHKSQGSEYPVVVIPVLIQHYMLLQRNLIYTAVTRGQQLVIMVGTRKALAIAVNNSKTEQRFTHLANRLVEPPGTPRSFHYGSTMRSRINP